MNLLENQKKMMKLTICLKSTVVDYGWIRTGSEQGKFEAYAVYNSDFCYIANFA